ncbi:plasmid mobilization protein [Burkholderia multivorans]|uniref:plasmid mobilization protein n=1 Tax=Burkholderia multivorans TaxID=87883 RepID=UPI001C26C4F1|nr:plasmid mobilization relaxosome protein MobC [Burkholderia multivorans]MBU9542860.1 plasmid mobilization relaxosome protein MobC [Burkholderia multivorans]
MKKVKQINLRLSDLQLQFIDKRAELNNYTNRSEFILDSLIYPQRLDKKRMKDMIYEVNKIGTNLMQITRYVNTHKQLDQSVLDCLNELKRQNDEILLRYKSL